MTDSLGITVNGRPAPELIIEVHHRDVRVIRRVSPTRHKGGGQRKAITGLSRQSRMRMYFTARNIPGLTHMLTLTYPGEYPSDGAAVKYHWKCMRQFLLRNGFKYGFWFLEFQQRGAPHYHIYLPTVKSSRDKAWLQTISRRWAEIVDSTDFENHVRAGTRFEKLRKPDATGGYVYKYVIKSEQKTVPDQYLNVGRFWGTWGKMAKTVSEVFAGFADELNLKLLSRLIRRQQKADARKNGKFIRKNKGRVGFVGWNGKLIFDALRKWFDADKDIPKTTSRGMAVPLSRLPR